MTVLVLLNALNCAKLQFGSSTKQILIKFQMKITETENNYELSKNDPAVGSNIETQRYNQEDSYHLKSLFDVVEKHFKVPNLSV